jgi:hypothetical protein
MFFTCRKKKKWYSIITEQEMVLAENNFFKTGYGLKGATP